MYKTTVGAALLLTLLIGCAPAEIDPPPGPAPVPTPTTPDTGAPAPAQVDARPALPLDAGVSAPDARQMPPSADTAAAPDSSPAPAMDAQPKPYPVCHAMNGLPIFKTGTCKQGGVVQNKDGYPCIICYQSDPAGGPDHGYPLTECTFTTALCVTSCTECR